MCSDDSHPSAAAPSDYAASVRIATQLPSLPSCRCSTCGWRAPHCRHRATEQTAAAAGVGGRLGVWVKPRNTALEACVGRHKRVSPNSLAAHSATHTHRDAQVAQQALLLVVLDALLPQLILCAQRRHRRPAVGQRAEPRQGAAGRAQVDGGLEPLTAAEVALRLLPSWPPSDHASKQLGGRQQARASAAAPWATHR